MTVTSAKRISEFTDAGTLDGTEEAVIEKSDGSFNKTTTQAIANLRAQEVEVNAPDESTADATTTTVIAADNSAPPRTEGDLLFSEEFVPDAAGSRCFVSVVLPIFEASGGEGVLSIYDEATNIGSFALNGIGGGTYVAYFSPSDTTTRTITARIGISAGTLYINRIAAGGRYGSATNALMVITEFAQ